MHKFACTILPVLFLSSPSLSHKVFTAKSEPIAKAAAQTKTYVKGWDVRVSTVAYMQQTYQGKHGVHQAANTWIAVTVTCQNTTGKTQESGASPMNRYSAQMIDTYGRTHSVRETDNDDLSSFPYGLNESRTEVWLFDVPTGTQASQLVLNSSDKNSIRLMLW
jgi:hypothetical protein